jgi:hypothetical protein
MQSYSRRGIGRPPRRGTFSSSPYNPFGHREPTAAELLKGTVKKIDTLEAPSPDAGISADVSLEGFQVVGCTAGRIGSSLRSSSQVKYRHPFYQISANDVDV